MISWETIAYGAVLSAVAAAAFVLALRRNRRVEVVAAAAASGFVGPLLWNAILHRVQGGQFFVDAPIAVMPASWQDTASGVFTVAVAAVVLGLGPSRHEPARHVALAAVACGVGAFLVDVYLY